jgi:hypothetical protein
MAGRPQRRDKIEGDEIDLDALMPAPEPNSKYQPTPTQRVIVAALSACNVAQSGIAAYMHMPVTSLQRHFRDELDSGYDRTEAALTGILSAKAMSGNLAAITFLLETKFGWRKNNRLGDSGTITIDQLSDAAQATIIADLRASIAAAEAGTGTRGKDKTAMVAATGTTNGSNRE